MLTVDPIRRRMLFGRYAVREPSPARARIATIGTACLAQRNVVCRTCGDECEEDAIRFRPVIGGVAVPVLVPDRCNGCGACVPVCPAAAITVAGPAVAGTRGVGSAP